MPGVPGGVFLVMAPVLTSVGVPAEGVGLLLAVDPITDAFRTLTNVTGHVVITAIVGKAETGEADTGTAETGTAETGTAETGTAETGTAETGTATLRA